MVNIPQTWEARDSTTRTLDLLYHTKAKSLPMLLLSTDAEKAIDRVAWDLLHLTLEHIGLQRRMRLCIEALYSGPSGAVKVNGIPSAPFQMWNGTR